MHSRIFVGDGQFCISFTKQTEADEVCELLKDLLEQRSTPQKVDPSPTVCIYCGKKRPCCATLT